MVENKIIVLDFGGQYAHLIARRVRELGVFSEIALPNAPLEKIKEAKGIILSGSPHSIGKNSPNFNSKIFEIGTPILGICYGIHLMAEEFKGKTGKGQKKEFGKTEIKLEKDSKLFDGLPEKQVVWMSHYDQVTEMPEGFELIGSTETCKITAIADEKREFYGLQFHPEVVHTEHGMELLANFVFDICGCKKNWSIQNYLEEKCREIKEKMGEKKVLLLASGGVDSTVALALLGLALEKNQIFALHVDTGLMRKNEASEVKKALEELDLAQLKVVDYSKQFFNSLNGIVEPEKKREIIGKLFLDITKKEVEKLGFNEKEWVLAQGTIYPDTIETARTKYSNKIKTHHNRVPEMVKMVEKGTVIEPLNDLYKDEVRELGKLIGLSDSIIWRHPFPGPGLGIRVLCSKGKKLSKELLEEEKKAQRIAKKHGFKARVLPVKSVGVQGDMRSYEHPVLLSGRLNWQKLEKASIELTNSLNKINRVVYLVKPKKLKKIKPKKAFLEKNRVNACREADNSVHNTIMEKKIQMEIWQFPVILLPLNIGEKREAIVLRPVKSKEAMTAEFYKMKPKILEEIAEKILKEKEIGAVFYDVSNKPPATIEWE